MCGTIEVICVINKIPFLNHELLNYDEDQYVSNCLQWIVVETLVK